MTYNYFHAFKRKYIHILKVEGPLFEKAPTQEIEHPFRYGVCNIYRVPFTKFGIGIGKWTGVTNEWDALAMALSVRPLDVETEEVRTW